MTTTTTHVHPIDPAADDDDRVASPRLASPSRIEFGCQIARRRAGSYRRSIVADDQNQYAERASGRAGRGGAGHLGNCSFGRAVLALVSSSVCFPSGPCSFCWPAPAGGYLARQPNGLRWRVYRTDVEQRATSRPAARPVTRTGYAALIQFASGPR